MNIVNKLTLRHLRLNKKRTLITIIGVIISVAMITGVATLSISFLDLMKRASIANDGNWHVAYQDLNQKQLDATLKNEHYDEITISKNLGYARLEGSKNRNKPYLFVKEYNDVGLKNFPIKLKEGRMPQKEGEVILSSDIADKGGVNYKVGSILNLQIGQRSSTEAETKGNLLDQTYNIEWDDAGNAKEELVPQEKVQYKVVGIMESPKWEPKWSPGYTVVSYLDVTNLPATKTVDVYATVKYVNKSLFGEAEKFAEKQGISHYDYNRDLLRFYGVEGSDAGRKMLSGLTITIMAIIIVGSISLIYNAFAISVSERSRHLGMLSSVGATRRQKRNSVFFEGLVIGGISIPIGLAAGLIGIGCTFLWINTSMRDALGLNEQFKLIISPSTLILAAIISMITIFISSYIPAIRASKVSPIDAIRQTTDIKLTGRAVKTSKLTRKIFGLEGEIGLKNLKRNRRRYQATVFSLVISIVLFLGVSYFSNTLQQSLAMTQAGIDYDMMVTIGYDDEKTANEKASEILAMRQFTKANDMISLSSFKPDDTNMQVIYVYALEDAALADYVKDIGANYDALKDTEKMGAIVIDPVSYLDMKEKKYVNETTIHGKQGDQCAIPYYTHDKSDGRTVKKLLGEVTIQAFTDKLPLGVQTSYQGNSGHIIVSKDVLNKLMKQNPEVKDNLQIKRELYFNTDNPDAFQESIEALGDNYIYVYNVQEYKEQEGQLMLLMGVFVYGFIILITAICVANIFNTISTSVALRKREFAMLKSVGMTPEGFRKMIRYESIFYGLKAILYGVPISILLMYFLYKTYSINFEYSFMIPWKSIIWAVIVVFAIVSITMLYSSNKLKRESIVDGLKQENI